MKTKDNSRALNYKFHLDRFFLMLWMTNIHQKVQLLMEQISLMCIWSATTASDMIKTYICMPGVSDFQSSNPAVSRGRQLTGRPLSIRKFLACARPSKLTTNTHTHTYIYIYIYIHGVLLYCISCPRNTDYTGRFFTLLSAFLIFEQCTHEKLVNFVCLCTNVVARFHRQILIQWDALMNSYGTRILLAFSQM